MISNIEHKNGVMTVTTATGDVVTRKTDAAYSAVIVGKTSAGKLCIAFASKTEATARTMLGKALSNPAKGSTVYYKFLGLTELQLIVPDAGWVPADQDEMARRDAALIAANRARREAEAAARNERTRSATQYDIYGGDRP